MTIYISGPMEGLPDNNAVEFNHMARVLRHRGFEAINPAELDAIEPGKPREHYLRRDYKALCGEEVKGIAMLRNWEESVGASTEYAIAKSLGLEIYSWTCLPRGRHEA